MVPQSFNLLVLYMFINTGKMVPRKGVVAAHVGETTVDEAPAAYKPVDDIIGSIADAVDIIDAMKPIYNFKAS